MRDRREQQAVLLGTAVGAISGAVLGLVFSRWLHERRPAVRKAIKPTQIVRLGGAIAVVVRQVFKLLS
jgi:hypothetical protein